MQEPVQPLCGRREQTECKCVQVKHARRFVIDYVNVDVSALQYALTCICECSLVSIERDPHGADAYKHIDNRDNGEEQPSRWQREVLMSPSFNACASSRRRLSFFCFH